MKYFMIFLVLAGLFTSSVFAFEPSSTNYFSNSEFQIYKIYENSYEFSIPYKISNAELDRIIVDCDSTALIIYLDKVGTEGNLIINIPRALLDMKIQGKDDSFVVIIDQLETEYQEISTDPDSRTLYISLRPDSQTLEIIATSMGMFPEPNPCGIGGIDDSPYYRLVSPLKQFNLGIPIFEIQCKENLFLVQKYDGSPACVTESTKTKLIERGWTSTNGVHDAVGSSNGHWKLKTEVFVATGLKELTPIDTVKIGGQYSATAILTKPHGMSDQHPELGYVMYVQVRDPNGDWIAGSWHHGIIKTDQTISAGTYWSPKDAGNYTIEVFAWQSFTGTPHADVSRHTIEVTK